MPSKVKSPSKTFDVVLGPTASVLKHCNCFNIDAVLVSD